MRQQMIAAVAAAVAAAVREVGQEAAIAVATVTQRKRERRKGKSKTSLRVLSQRRPRSLFGKAARLVTHQTCRLLSQVLFDSHLT